MKKMTTARLILVIILLALYGCATTPDTMPEKRIAVLDPDYEEERLAANTTLPGVNGATIGADGNLYVTHTGNSTITKVDLANMTPSLFVPASTGVFIPDDIAADDKGNFYVTGTTPLVGEVYRIDPNGVKTVIADGMDAPNGIEYDPRTGRLFVTECFQGNRIYEVDPTGQTPVRLLIDKDIIAVPEGFGFDPDSGDLIIPDMKSGKILRVHPDSGAISTIAENFSAPIALTIGSDKMIYIPEVGTGTVYKLSLDGAEREKIAQLTPGLDNLAITPEGRLFVTSYWNATIWEIATDGSAKVEKLFPDGINQLLGVVAKEDTVYIADAIMVRSVTDQTYQQTKLNAWAVHGMPLTLSLADGPGNHVFWTDCIHGAVAVGNPAKGEFKPVAGELDRPVSALMDASGRRLFVAEYGAGRISAVNLANGAKSVVAEELEGPLAMAMIDDTLYVAESKAGSVCAIDPATGDKAVFLAAMVGKPSALAHDGRGNLLVLDSAGQKLIRVNPQTRAVTAVAAHLPIQHAIIGHHPAVEFPQPMTVDNTGNIYLGTNDRGLLMLKRRQ